MSRLAHFQQYKLRYEVLMLFCFFFINATIIATSVIMEAKRDDKLLPFDLWEPFVWEYTSGFASLLLFPLVAQLLKRHPFNWQAIKRSLVVYFIASIVFSLCHVGLMVTFRELIYLLMAGNYDFGDIGYELLYEYRKDLWSFCFFIVLIQAYGFIVSRLQGEANPVSEGEEAISPSFDRLLVKKLGKEFILRVEDIEWLESSGNYVNLHSKGRIYPMRTTLQKLSKQLESKGFCRIHRSAAINMDCVDSITPLPSGDSEVKLNTGKVLNLSRRYKEAFKEQLT